MKKKEIPAPINIIASVVIKTLLPLSAIRDVNTIMNIPIMNIGNSNKPEYFEGM